MTTTITQSGETWDMISKRVYGDEHFMHELIAANVQHRKTVLFRSGVVLNVPAIDINSTAYDTNLPLWKRG